MHKLLFGVLMAVVWWMLHALQWEEERAMGLLYEVKRAVNRAAHAAAQQADRDKLEIGIPSIDPGLARAAAHLYLQANLRLDRDFRPLPGSPLRQPPAVLVFEVINEEHEFPYTYYNPEYNYRVTLKRPGVVMVVRAEYPRVFNVMDPVVWHIKGAAEQVHV
ncbi:MAG TPA: hypothetical protein VIL22_02305 [Paenibacillaceae bacterium]